MAASKARVTEVIDYAMIHGEEEACALYNLPLETLNRYKRSYKGIYGENADLIIALKKQFTDSEIKGMIRSGRITPFPTSDTAISFEGETVTFGIMSDTHIGSVDCDPAYIEYAFNVFEQTGCSYVFHPGDVVEGMMNRPSHVYELSHIGFTRQRDEAIRLLSLWKKPLYVIGGNHDFSLDTKHGMGVDIVYEICKAIPNAVYLGPTQGDVTLNGVKFRMYHGNDRGGSYALSHRGQKISERIPADQKPDVLMIGHAHNACVLKYRGCWNIDAGSIQKQTGFMTGMGLTAAVGFYVVTMTIRDGKIVKFLPEWYDLQEASDGE